jgi:hypothetical protein
MTREPRYTLVVKDLSANDVASLLIAMECMERNDGSYPIQRGIANKLGRACRVILDSYDEWRKGTFACARRCR